MGDNIVSGIYLHSPLFKVEEVGGSREGGINFLLFCPLLKFSLTLKYFFSKGYIPDDLSSNIKVLPWIPQNDLLAHNSTKAFISHGGHNSLYEAAFYGVPLVCVPIFADQLSNCVQAQSVGIATGIDIKSVTGDEVYQAIRRILEEPR